MRAAVLLVSFAVASFVPGAAQAQNFIVNGGFDTDVSGWTSGSPGLLTLDWTAEDARGLAGSGSLLASIPGDGLNSTISQCAASPVVAGSAYDFGADVRIPAGGPQGQTFLRLTWFPGPGCTGAPQFFGGPQAPATGSWQTIGATGVVAPAGAVSARIGLQLIKNFANALPYETLFDNIFLGRTGTCIPGPATLCIDGAPGDFRFRVEVEFATVQSGGLSGFARAVPLASVGIRRGGAFWFFGPENPEMLIKVLDACAFNQRYWVFFSAGTNVGFTVRVRDTHTAQQKTYTNPDLHAAAPVQDTSAFPCS